MKLEGIGPQTKGYLADHGVCPNQETASVSGQSSVVRCQKTQSAESRAQSIQFMTNKRYALSAMRYAANGVSCNGLLTTDH